MAAFPPDVFLIEPRGILYTRFQRDGRIELTALSRVPLAESVFVTGSTAPVLNEPVAMVEALGRIASNRKIENISVLLPDSWFKLHMLTLDTLPDRRSEADEIILWSLKRALPGRSNGLRLAWEIIERTGKGARVAVLETSGESVSRLETAIETAGMHAVVIEPLGLSLWNALAGAVPADGEERLLFLSRQQDLVLAVFRGDQPLFYRSKRISPQHDLIQEIRLSASYLKNHIGIGSPAICWVAGDRIETTLREAISRELNAPVHNITLEDVGLRAETVDVRGEEIAVAAAMGVFAA